MLFHLGMLLALALSWGKWRELSEVEVSLLGGWLTLILGSLLSSACNPEISWAYSYLRVFKCEGKGALACLAKNPTVPGMGSCMGWLSGQTEELQPQALWMRRAGATPHRPRPRWTPRYPPKPNHKGGMWPALRAPSLQNSLCSPGRLPQRGASKGPTNLAWAWADPAMRAIPWQGRCCCSGPRPGRPPLLRFAVDTLALC